MKQLIQHINYNNHKFIYFCKTSKTVIDLSNKKYVSNDDSSSNMRDIQNSILMSIVDTLENYLSHYEGNINTRKVRVPIL